LGRKAVTVGGTSAAMRRAAETVEAAALALGLKLSAGQVELLLRYRDQLAKWNGVYNLTALRDPDDMLTHHIVDSMAALPALLRQRSAVARVLDAGSGGGLPGVVWVICHPALQVLCVDAVGKKAAFVQQAAIALGLPHLQGLHARVEDLPTKVRGTGFEVITSRAFASLADFCALSKDALALGGLWMALKGKIPSDEMALLPSTIDVFHVEPLRVPGLQAERCVVWLRPRPSA
jgi:16S rRNA (guanine527-N7)-methyltransferase